MFEYSYGVSKVMDQLHEDGYCKTILQINEHYFMKLGEYLEQRGDDYTPETVNEWLMSCSGDISPEHHSVLKIGLQRLQIFYETGNIRLGHLRGKNAYLQLIDNFKIDLDAYLFSMCNNYSPKTIARHRKTCSEFLLFAQKAGIIKIEDLTFEFVQAYYMMSLEWNSSERQNITLVSAMMYFLFEKGKISYSFSIILHYIAIRNGICYWNQISSTTLERVQNLMLSQPTVSTRQLVEIKEAINRGLKQNEYRKATKVVFNSSIDLLILFLDMNGYEYSPQIADLWLQEMHPVFGTGFHSAHRALGLVSDYLHTERVEFKTVYSLKPTAFELIPAWCRKPAMQYVDIKKKEGWARSTLDMIRSSIMRFCNYLDAIGIRSFMDVTASQIAQFNKDDKHKTAAGKNAYNIRIRKFLIFLGEKEYLNNPMLFLALPKASAPKETIVVTLTKDEMQELTEKLDDDNNEISLRKKAMLLLGLKMGIRASDIVNLNIDNIDWDEASIRFIQQKTCVEVCLPMPTIVGNALFRYIMEERHPKEEKAIFLSSKAPYAPIKSRSACSEALRSALPDRHVDGSGFHVTRKTYASERLQNNVSVDAVAEMLGQQNTASVHRYLALDEQRMRMCALSLEDYKIGGWHNGCT